MQKRRAFYHDVANALTISLEMAKSAKRRLDAETFDKELVLTKLEKSILAMERLEILLAEEKERLKSQQ